MRLLLLISVALCLSACARSYAQDANPALAAEPVRVGILYFAAERPAGEVTIQRGDRKATFGTGNPSAGFVYEGDTIHVVQVGENNTVRLDLFKPGLVWTLPEGTILRAGKEAFTRIAGDEPKLAVREVIVERVVERPVERVVERVVERIIYRDRVVRVTPRRGGSDVRPTGPRPAIPAVSKRNKPKVRR